MKSKASNLLILHLTVFIFGFTGILGDLITLPADLLVFYRCFIAFVALAIVGLAFKKLKKLPIAMMFQLMGIGVVTAVHWILFFGAIKVSTISVGVAIMASTALWIALIEPLISWRKIDYREILLGIVVIIGLGIIFSVERKYMLGIVLALLSAVFAAIFSVLNSKMIKKTDSYNIAFYEMLAASAAVFIYLNFFGDLGTSVSPMNWFYLIILGTLATAFAFVMSVEVMKVLSPFTVGISINLEPIYTIILALLIFPKKEEMSFGFYIGTAILIIAIFLDTYMRRRERKRRAKLDPIS